MWPFGTEMAGHCSMLPTKVRLLPRRVGAACGAGLGSSVSCVLRSPLMAGSCAQVGKTRASTPTLVVVDGEDQGRRLPLVGKTQFRIGRSVTSDLKLLDGKISRDHCIVESVRDHHIIIDLESANGTVVNGERVKKTVLKEGDFIRLGYTMLKYDRV